MKPITITAAMNRLICCQIWGMNFELNANSIVTDVLSDSNINPYPPTNDKMGKYITRDYNADTDTRSLKIGMLMLGRGGHGYVTNNKGEIDPTTYPHRSTDTGLFIPMPMIVRTLDNDLTGDEKALYRARQVFEKNGVLYAAYFGKIFDASTSEILEVIETVEDGVVTESSVYEATVNDLRPTKDSINTDSNGVFMRTYAGMDFTLTEVEVEEIVNACEVLYGDGNKAVVSEIAFCFGIDVPVTTKYSETDGTTIVEAPPLSNEFIAAHMGVVESTFKPIVFSNAISERKQIGISEPLYGTR